MHRIWMAVFLLALPCAANAQEPLSRADGFARIWESLNRPLGQTKEPPFEDVSVGSAHYPLLTYAKARGILDDAGYFYPNEPLTMQDALVWLFRSRNTAYAPNITQTSLQRLLERYPITSLPKENQELTLEELQTLMGNLDEQLKEERHAVSYYGDDFAGRNTAFGETFNPNTLTAAHKTFPHNTLVRVTNHENGKSVTVRINDRGPYVSGRDMDLSRAAFQQLAPLSNGVIHNITFERLGSAEQVSVCPTIKYQRRLGRILLSPGIPRTAPRGTTIHLGANRSFRMIQMRSPGSRPVRSSKWTARGETLDISFESIGTYTFVMHEDSGRRRRFRTRVVGECV
jgi:hypothetical protein